MKNDLLTKILLIVLNLTAGAGLSMMSDIKAEFKDLKNKIETINSRLYTAESNIKVIQEAKINFNRLN